MTRLADLLADVDRAGQARFLTPVCLVPNGGAHLGHVAGPLLRMDVLRRILRWSGAGTEREGPMTDEDLLRMASMVRSVRWALLVRLLLEAGADNDVLGQSAATFRAYAQSEEFWRGQHPRIFDTSS